MSCSFHRLLIVRLEQIAHMVLKVSLLTGQYLHWITGAHEQSNRGAQEHTRAHQSTLAQENSTGAPQRTSTGAHDIVQEESL
jgi:hypothetical protein